MTNQEAIGVIKHNLPSRRPILRAALNMAIKALEKQTPKKPDLFGDGYADGYLVYDTWECPGCKKEYEVDYDKYDYCPACGQAIDWSEEDEE